MDKENKHKPITIRCHPELIEILERLRNTHNKLTYGLVKISYYELTAVLAKKINKQIH